MRIYITGMPGSGKTFLGKRLAKTLHLPFIDLDDHVEALKGKNIRSIIAEEGELSFRHAERECLHRTAMYKDAVISCGGGTVAWFDNMQWIKLNGTSIWLKTEPEKILDRILKNQSRRPMFAGLTAAETNDKIMSLLAERLPFYRKADIILAENPQVEKTLNTVIQRLMKPLRRR